jgi:adenosine/AMP kinase
MELLTVKMTIPEGANLILGQSHFIKTVEDLYEAIVTTAPGMKFGLAFNEASGACLTRLEGNDSELKRAAAANAGELAAGHVFVVVLKDGFPINVLKRIQEVAEVVNVFCATANPVEPLKDAASSAWWTVRRRRASRASRTSPGAGICSAKSDTSVSHEVQS